jgi:hypothetical protein
LNAVSVAELPGSARVEGVKASDAAAIDAPPARTSRRLCVLLIRHLLVRMARGNVIYGCYGRMRARD